MRWIFCLLVMLDPAVGQRTDLWDLPPLRYSDSTARDRVAGLAVRLDSDPPPDPGSTGLERLRFVLDWLEVPESSQILVFSKTSKQIRRIDPSTPRALYFSDRHYVGYVPGGAIEVIAQDPLLGPVFYLIEAGGDGDLRIERDRSDCLSCHGTARTEGAPGVLVRSVFPDGDGRPLLARGSTTVDHTTPVAERWGGYYVTGNSSIGHLGNRVFRPDGGDAEEGRLLSPGDGTVDFSRYPRRTSDIVALMVLEHQCRVHNLMTAAALRYGRASWLQHAIDPAADPDRGQAGRIAREMAGEIVEALLFRDEADLGDGVEGDREFQRDYAARYPRASNGRSLADFRLYERIFKHRCSCMIYSPVFHSLPATIRLSVLAQLRTALETGEGAGDHLPASERRKILGILEETLPDWSGGE